MMSTILIVEDERNMRDTMREFLEQEGFRILIATDGQAAIHTARAEKPEIVLLDWMLPGKSGIEVCRELRQLGTCGIIMITAKSDETDKVIGLEVGADDYMTKPFSLRELASRIRSLLRRLNPRPTESAVLRRGDLSIDADKHEVLRGGTLLSLTPTEYKLLLTLASSPGVVFSRLQLMRAAMDEDLMNYERTLDSHISKLRKKLEPDPAHPRYVQTVFGFGYRFGE